MSPAPAQCEQRVLHIRPDPTGDATTDNLDAELAANELPFDTCADVYRGLAHLCVASDHGYSIAVVSVDALGDAEMEFFTIAARACRATTVYVYGDERLKSRLADACERGASGVVTSKTLKGLMATATTPTVLAPVDSTPPNDPANPPSESQDDAPRDAPGWDADSSAASIERAALAAPVAGEGSELHDSVDQPHDEITDPDPIGVEADEGDPIEIDEEDTAPDLEIDEGSAGETGGDSADVRVPWLRYGNTPGRTAPKPRGPSPSESRGDAESHPRSILHEPLLTDEELRALLGDDEFAADEVTSPAPPNVVAGDEDDRS